MFDCTNIWLYKIIFSSIDTLPLCYYINSRESEQWWETRHAMGIIFRVAMTAVLWSCETCGTCHRIALFVINMGSTPVWCTMHILMYIIYCVLSSEGVVTKEIVGRWTGSNVVQILSSSALYTDTGYRIPDSLKQIDASRLYEQKY